MTTLLYHHPIFAQHDTGPGHPESPARINAVMQALEDSAFAGLERHEAPRASLDQLALIHSRAFIERIEATIPQSGLVGLDADTVVSPHSWEAALRASGAVCSAVDAVMAGAGSNAFCAVRPPGHHAEPERAMGFCIFNSVAIGAAHARQRHGLARAAVIDFDVHHGNGTQAAFWSDASYLYISSHQAPLYPGTGSYNERGEAGNIVNVPLPPGSGGEQLQPAWNEIMEPALREFQPDFILISAGFDAHARDPLAQLNFSEDDYVWLTERILRVAEEQCQGRVVSALEGGYNLTALAASVGAHVKTLMAV
jgi:acetoin utilization deacetylase AcuC-like enzyme